MPNACAGCGYGNAADARFCAQCGLALAMQGAPPIAEGERRHVTALFCDLVDSTPIAARLDPEDWRDTLAAYHRAANAAVTRFDGHVAQYLGDGVFACFGYPHSHDDDAERAVRAGLAIVEGTAALGDRLAVVCPDRLRVRVGIHTGTVVVGPGAGGASQMFGDVLHLAARVQGVAAPDSVLITAATHRLVAGRVLVSDRGATELKGIPEPVTLHRVEGLSIARGRLDAAAGRGLTPFVGREDDRRTLATGWTLAQGGAGQVALITGDAGIGKSRLIRSLREHATGSAHTWIECAGSPYARSTAFHPVIDAMRQLLGGTEMETAEGTLSRLAARLTEAGLDPADAVPLLAPLLSLPVPEEYPELALTPEARRWRTVVTLSAWLCGAARVEPMVFVLEDLHWVDPSTLELQALLVEEGAAVPLLQLYSARPEFRSSLPARPYCVHLRLNRLAEVEVREIVRHVAGRALPEALVDTVAVRTDGVPLFVEEVTLAVLERQEANPELPIPTTLQASLQARLDRLGFAKEVAQVGATIGREFSRPLLEAVLGGPPADLDGHLARLLDAGLLYATGPSHDAVYRFKHALIRDAAYESLLKLRRRELHRAVARALATHFPHQVESQPELLAHHHTQSGDAEAAVTAWQRAGRQATARSALVEAVDHYDMALDLLAALPAARERTQRELVLQIAKGTALMAIRGYGAADLLGPYTRARELAEELGDVRHLLLVLSGLWVSSFTRRDLTAARELADETMRVAEAHGGLPGRVWGCVFQGITSYSIGEIPVAYDYLEQAIALYDEAELRDAQTDPGVPAFGYASMAAWHLGLVDVARRRAAETIALGRRLQKAYDLAYAYALGTFVHIYLDEPQQALALAEPLIELARQQHFPFFLGLGMMNRGWANAREGRHADGIAELREGFSVYRSTARVAFDLYLGLLADVQARAGDLAGAGETIDEVLAGCVPFEVDCPELLRQRAVLLERSAAPAVQLEAAYRDAIAVAQRMGSRGYELRTASSFCRWLARAGRAGEAHAVLAPLVARFGEAVETNDLRAARALLSGLPH